MSNAKKMRKPIGNFFIKKELQLRLIVRIVTAALLSTLLSSASLILVYYVKYKTVIVYQLDKLTQELNREHIVFLILPTLLVSVIVSVIVAFGIGLYASRKYAVPIYKLEQWASLLIGGKLAAMLRFREKEEMKELSDKCNQLSKEMMDRFLQIKNLSKTLKENETTANISNSIEKALEGLDLEPNLIEVTTGFYSVPKNTSEKKEGN